MLPGAEQRDQLVSLRGNHQREAAHLTLATGALMYNKEAPLNLGLIAPFSIHYFQNTKPDTAESFGMS